VAFVRLAVEGVETIQHTVVTEVADSVVVETVVPSSAEVVEVTSDPGNGGPPGSSFVSGFIFTLTGIA
jgi:hypothetical protein